MGKTKVLLKDSKGVVWGEAEFDNVSDAAAFMKGMASRGRPIGSTKETRGPGKPRKKGRAGKGATAT